MPGMDGIEATRLIRGLGTPYAANLPIIALTANALNGSEGMFLEEGFQDFLSKPINLNHLDKVVGRWIGAGAANANDGADGAVPPAEIPGIDTGDALALYGGDEQLFVRILHSCVRNVPAQLNRMRGASVESAHEYTLDIHTMKGVLSGIGANGLAERADRIERMIKAGDIAGVLEVNGDFIGEAEALLDNILKWLSDRTG
jgi:CheY-like chemotaxis protein